MKLHTTLISLFFCWLCMTISNVTATTYNVSALLGVNECSLTCLTDHIPYSGCDIADIGCQCSSQKLVDTTYACMLENCTITEMVQLGLAREQLCELKTDPNRAQKLIIVTAIVMSISCSIVVFRIAVRVIIDRRLNLEEWLIVGASFFCFASGILVFWIARHGYGQHTYYLDAPSIAYLFKRYFIVESTYLFGLMLAKLSILRLYLTLLPGKKTRIVTMVAIAVVLSSGMATLLTQINQCHPIERSWDKDVSGTCLDLNKIALASTGVNVAQDLLILLIPIPLLTKLDVRIEQKIFMLFLFGLYGFALVTSAIRIQFIYNLGKYLVDPAYDDAPGTTWSAIDMNISIICACLPSLPGTIRRLQYCCTRSYGTRSTIVLDSHPHGSHLGATRYGRDYYDGGCYRSNRLVRSIDVNVPEVAEHERILDQKRWSNSTVSPSDWASPVSSRSPVEGQAFSFSVDGRAFRTPILQIPLAVITPPAAASASDSSTSNTAKITTTTTITSTTPTTNSAFTNPRPVPSFSTPIFDCHRLRSNSISLAVFNGQPQGSNLGTQTLCYSTNAAETIPSTEDSISAADPVSPIDNYDYHTNTNALISATPRPNHSATRPAPVGSKAERVVGKVQLSPDGLFTCNTSEPIRWSQEGFPADALVVPPSSFEPASSKSNGAAATAAAAAESIRSLGSLTSLRSLAVLKSTQSLNSLGKARAVTPPPGVGGGGVGVHPHPRQHQRSGSWSERGLERSVPERRPPSAGLALAQRSRQRSIAEAIEEGGIGCAQ